MSQFIRTLLILTLKCWRPFQYFKQHMKPCGHSTGMALEKLWKSFPSGLPSHFASLCFCVLHCTALTQTLCPFTTKLALFCQHDMLNQLVVGSETPDPVILSKVKLQRLGNGSAFPTGCDQHDFNLTNTGLTTPLQMRFKLGFCTLWYVF